MLWQRLQRTGWWVHWPGNREASRNPDFPLAQTGWASNLIKPKFYRICSQAYCLGLGNETPVRLNILPLAGGHSLRQGVCSQVSELGPMYPQRRAPRRRDAHLNVTRTLGSRVCVLPTQAGQACHRGKSRTSPPPTPALHLTPLNPGQAFWQLASGSNKSALNRKIQTPQTGSWAYTSIPGQPKSSRQCFGFLL